MPGKDRRTALRSKVYEKNITKRGAVPNSQKKRKEKVPVGPIFLGVLLFLLIGSAVFQIIGTSRSSSPIV